MASTPTANLRLSKPATADRLWDINLNGNADALDALTPLGGLFARAAESPSTTLNVNVTAGSFAQAAGSVLAFAGGTIAVAASATSNVWLTDAGVLAAGAAWPALPHARLAIVTAGPTAITSVVDARLAGRSAGFPGPTLKEGTAASRLGLATLAAGSVVVATTAVTAASRVFLSVQTPGGTPGFLSASARTAGVSFTITSSSGTDTSTVAWMIVEPS
jgi:hypothetical protein